MLMVTQPASTQIASPPAANDALLQFISAFLLLHYGLNVFLRDSFQPIEELAPTDGAIVPDDRNGRDAAALDDDVTLRRGLHAGHVAYVVLELAGEPDPVVSELLEKSQEAALYRSGCAGAAERRDVLHRALTDALGVVTRAARDPHVHAHRLPVDELERSDLRVDAAGDRAEIERSGEQLEVEILQIEVAMQPRRRSESVDELDFRRRHHAVEGVDDQRPVHLHAAAP